MLQSIGVHASSVQVEIRIQFLWAIDKFSHTRLYGVSVLFLST